MPLVCPAFPLDWCVVGPWWGGVDAGQAAAGGAWVVVNKPVKASRCAQLIGSRRVMCRDRRAMRAGMLIRWRRRVPVRALA